MELIAIFLLVVLTFLSYRLWIWWKTNGSGQRVLDQLPYRIRSKLGLVSINELKAVQEHLLSLEHQVHAGLALLEKTRPIRKYPQEINFLDVHFEQSRNLISAKDVSFPRPRSIVWNGLRFTLSDSIWSYMEVMPREDLVDSQIQAMVQGPFCRGCLKRLARKDRIHAAEVPAQCRHCGLSWSNEASDNLPISLVDLKRRFMTTLNPNGE
jgi:hypothetical protein